jgi:hypothetical protein
MADVPLHPALATLASTLVVTDQVSFPTESLLVAAESLLAIEGDRSEVEAQLLAYARLCHQKAGDRATPAVAQLSYLLALLIGESAALQVVTGAGLANTDALKKAIGLEESKVPIGGPRPGNATSPLGARLFKAKR